MADFQIQHYLSLFQDQDLVAFFEDCINFSKGYKIPFLAKYGDTVGAGNVISVRDFMLDIIQAGLRKSPSNATLDTVKEGIMQWIQENQFELESKMIEILSVCVFARREELRRIFTELLYYKSVDLHLVDYNYNIELCVSSETMAKVNEPMLILELYIRGHDSKKIQRTVIEMNKQEAKAFVGKLKEIEREMIGTSQ